MIPQRRPLGPAPVSGPRHLDLPTPIDWVQWVRKIERHRRLLSRVAPLFRNPFWPAYYVEATASSFRLEGLVVPRTDLAATLARGGARAVFRSRQQQRARNHVAILRHVERLLRDGLSLEPDDVIRWYTSVACGLSTDTRLGGPTSLRLESLLRQVNSPHLRLCPAVQGIARLHRQMLADPVVPSFNGILARLVLRYHLGRCGLPPAVFKGETDAPRLLEEPRLLARLMELIDESYAAQLAGAI